jgi:signal peptidase complex subunit 2
VQTGITYILAYHFLTIFLGRFTNERVLVEGLFWKDVEKLIDEYNSDRKSK